VEGLRAEAAHTCQGRSCRTKTPSSGRSCWRSRGRQTNGTHALSPRGLPTARQQRPRTPRNVPSHLRVFPVTTMGAAAVPPPSALMTMPAPLTVFPVTVPPMMLAERYLVPRHRGNKHDMRPLVPIRQHRPHHHPECVYTLCFAYAWVLSFAFFSECDNVGARCPLGAKNDAWISGSSYVNSFCCYTFWIPGSD
jgi:hypothetical protein